MGFQVTQRGIGYFLLSSNIALLMVGCAKVHTVTSDPATVSVAPTQLSGNVVMGPVNTAIVKAYRINPADGSADTSQVLASTLTDAQGNYTLSLAVSEPVIIQTCGGNYVDEASGIHV